MIGALPSVIHTNTPSPLPKVTVIQRLFKDWPVSEGRTFKPSTLKFLSHEYAIYLFDSALFVCHILNGTVLLECKLKPQESVASIELLESHILTFERTTLTTTREFVDLSNTSCRHSLELTSGTYKMRRVVFNKSQVVELDYEFASSKNLPSRTIVSLNLKTWKKEDNHYPSQFLQNDHENAINCLAGQIVYSHYLGTLSWGPNRIPIDELTWAKPGEELLIRMNNFPVILTLDKWTLFSSDSRIKTKKMLAIYRENSDLKPLFERYAPYIPFMEKNQLVVYRINHSNFLTTDSGSYIHAEIRENLLTVFHSQSFATYCLEKRQELSRKELDFEIKKVLSVTRDLALIETQEGNRGVIDLEQGILVN